LPEVVKQQATSVRLTPKSPQPRQLFSPLSPSVYSRNTDGMSILPNDSVMSFEGTNNDYTTHESGSAVIITSRSVKSYNIGTPSPKHGMESNRSSRDWKAWLSHEVSELDANAQSDYTFQSTYSPTVRQYSPPTSLPPSRHHREYSQIGEDDTTTVIMRESMDTIMPRRGADVDEAPIMESVEQSDASPIVAVAEVLPDTPPAPTEPPADLSSVKETHSLPFPMPSAIPRKQRLSSLSSAFSQRSSAASSSTNSTPTSARMNDRFPFIKSNRSSSSQSAKLRRTSRTPTGHSSGSSSLGSEATPSPKVYSDFSAPGTSRTSNYAPNTRSKRSGEVVGQDKERQKEARKENVTPTTQIRRPGQMRTGSTLSLPLTVARPKSMLPLSSAALNRSPSSLSQYTTTAEYGKQIAKQGRLASPEWSPQRQRLKVKISPISPSKLTARPKSAFDLRGANTPSTAMSRAHTSSPKKETDPQHQDAETVTQQHQTHDSSPINTSTAGLNTDALGMLLESPWADSEAPKSPRTSFELVAATRPKLRVMHSSSTLALNKEPSPGLEDRIIDSILEGEEQARSVGGVGGVGGVGSVGSVGSAADGGRVTPGQRMAERFLKERKSGVWTSVRGFEDDDVSGGLVRGDTPAFL